MKVTVIFVGICTHVLDRFTIPPSAEGGGSVPPGSIVRVVLVNGRVGSRMAQAAIPPHEAMLIIPREFIAGRVPEVAGLGVVSPDKPTTWTLNGVRMVVGNAAAPGVKLAATYAAMPSLTLSSGRADLGLNEEYIRGGSALGVFDVTAGELDAFRERDQKDVRGMLTIETTASPQLIVTRVWDQQVGTIPLQQATIDGQLTDPVIYVSNVGRMIDTPADFLLHYLTTTWVPDHVVEPRGHTEAHAGSHGHPIPDGLTVGCSNSVYP